MVSECLKCKGRRFNILGVEFVVTGDYDQESMLCDIKPLYYLSPTCIWDLMILPFVKVRNIAKWLFGIRSGKLGVICNEGRVKPIVICPYCGARQSVVYELQRCRKCKKKFFIF